MPGVGGKSSGRRTARPQSTLFDQAGANQERKVVQASGQAKVADYTVAELSEAIRKFLRQGFPTVRVTGEISKISHAAAGRVFFDLIEKNCVLRAVYWGARRGPSPWQSNNYSEGMKVRVTGAVTSYAGRSTYQLSVTHIEHVGAGQVLAEIEERKARLRDEGLFDLQKEDSLPFIPNIIGVVTAQSGAVIHDIMKTVGRRFPRPIIVWPVKVQGDHCSTSVVAAIRGFNALSPTPTDRALAHVPRPDVIIVARGGGSFEDLLGFNDEEVARAVANSDIPVISAIGHETDTTLIDLAANQRAATPTAAAELAVPDRRELNRSVETMLDSATGSWELALSGRVQRLQELSDRLYAQDGSIGGRQERLGSLAGRLRLAHVNLIGNRRLVLEKVTGRLVTPMVLQHARTKLALAGERIRIATVHKSAEHAGEQLDRQSQALEATWCQFYESHQARLHSVARLHASLNYQKTLRRGFAIVRDGDTIVATQEEARQSSKLEIEFQDGRLEVGV